MRVADSNHKIVLGKSGVLASIGPDLVVRNAPYLLRC